METINKTPVRFTKGAIAEIRRLMQLEGADSNKILRVGVKGGGCSGMTYILDFEEQTQDDSYFEIDGIPYLMHPSHGIYLTDMEIDFQGGLNSRGFTFSNPNASSTCGCGSSFGV